MSDISAQISLYPLGQANLEPAIEAVLAILARHGLPFEVGAMSTTTYGSDEVIFGALREAFAAATRFGPAVLTVTFSNACPVPQRPPEEPTNG